MTRRSPETAARIRREMVELLYSQPLPVITISVAYGVLTIAMAVHEADPVLYGFGIFGSVWSLARIASMRAFVRYYKPRHFPAWENVYAAGSFVFSATLGAMVGYTFLFSLPASQVISSSLLFAYGGGMIARISLVPWICKVNLSLAATLPAAALLFGPDDYTKIVLVLIALMYVGGYLTIGVIYNAVEGYVDGQRKLNQAASTDPLTGVPNRTAMKEHIVECIEMQSDSALLAIHFIDLDRFKQVNDTHGHIVGDEVLRMVAERLRMLVAPNDFVARYGGDEFIVVQSGIRGRREAEALGQTIVQALSDPYAVDGVRVEIGASDGIAIADREAASLDALLASSDTALYTAKRGGRGCVTTIDVGAFGSRRDEPETEVPAEPH